MPHAYFSNGCFIASTTSSYFGMTTLRHYTNARSACLRNVRDRMEAAWQEWELSCESSNLSLRQQESRGEKFTTSAANKSNASTSQLAWNNTKSCDEAELDNATIEIILAATP